MATQTPNILCSSPPNNSRENRCDTNRDEKNPDYREMKAKIKYDILTIIGDNDISMWASKFMDVINGFLCGPYHFHRTL